MAQKRARPASSVEEIDGRDDAPREEEQVLFGDDDAERTMSDLPVPMEVEVVMAESSARRAQIIPQVEDFQRAGLQLKAIRLLPDDASRRAALPLATALEDTIAWPIKRLRSLAVHCKLNPARGLMRRALIRLLNEFREEPVQLDLNEVPLQSVTLDAPQDELPGDGREEAARLRALEMSELLATVEEEEREAEDVDAQAERDRVEEEEALTAVHVSKMRDLRERLSAARRAKAQRRPLPRPTPTPPRPLVPPFPLLTESRVARMDKRLPRPVTRPEGLQPAAPSPNVGRPARENAGSDLVVRVFSSR
jgi:hypothetical protein